VSVLQPGLSTLSRLKWRGWWRRIGRRLRTPGGALFGLLGLALTGAWVWSILWRGSHVRVAEVLPEDALAVARGTLAMLGVVCFAGAFGHRGLHLPQDEIERMLSAPLTRRQLIRYRLLSAMLRSSVLALALGLILAPRMPVGGFGMAGAMLAVLTLPLLSQGAAILMGDAENRLGRLAARVPKIVTGGVMVLLAYGLIMVMLMDGLVPRDLAEVGPPRDLVLQVARHPIVVWLSLPAAPWAGAMAAPDLAHFVPWFLAALAASVLMFEVVARLPIDFRELSLATSADVARRLARAHSGRGPVGGSEVPDRAKGRRVAWLFGRSPSGAVAWIQLVALRRKARGALLFALMTTGFTLVLTTTVLREPFEGAFFLAIFGVIYLASGMRFDFRGNLDGLEEMRAWPVTPRRVFLATILPQALFVSGLMSVAQVVRLAVLGAWEPGVGLVIAATPVVTVFWLAVDNAIFLLAPVRFEPGQSAAMHHAGRQMVLALIKMLLLGLSAAVAGLAGYAAYGAFLGLGAPTGPATAAGVVAGTIMALLMVGAAVILGGWALRRFDVASVKARIG
jgi:ABC-2 type transport system permease protein